MPSNGEEHELIMRSVGYHFTREIFYPTVRRLFFSSLEPYPWSLK